MAEIEIDADAVQWSAPERERAGRPLLVLLHGIGSHEGDLFGLSPHLPLDPVIASLRAPLHEGNGYAWFERGGAAEAASRIAQADAAARGILRWLDTTDATSTGLLGFSQGGAMALQLMRLAPERFAYAVQLSGFVLGPTHAGDAALAARRPPVFWGRGTADPVIPAELIAVTSAWLPAHTTATERIYEDLAHAVSARELGDINDFIRAQLSAA